MNKKLDIITSESSNLNTLTIVNNENNSNLSYNTEDRGQINITNEGNRFRPIRLSELEKKLEQRDWNITERKYVSITEGKDYLKVKVTSSSGAIDTINSTTDTIDGKVIGVSVSNPLELDDSLKNQFNEDPNYKPILENMEGNEIYIYNSSRRVVDFINNSVIINAIKYNSDSYTSILSLDKLINNSAQPNISGKVDITIQYSKGNLIISHDTSFEAFKFNDNNEIEITEFIEEINSEVIMEYSGNTIRLIPVSNDVNECIIRNCIITYGNI